jgi:hypothetical protein
MSSTPGIELPSAGIYSRLNQKLVEQATTLRDSFHSAKRQDDIQDGELFIRYCQATSALLSSPQKCKKYLHSRGLNTYGDMKQMHQRIMEILDLDDYALDSLISTCHVNDPSHSRPELMGSLSIFLNVNDFIIAMPILPHPADSDQPTLLGMYLSACQGLFRDSRFFRLAASESDMMHLAMLLGVTYTGHIRTPTGEFLHDVLPHVLPPLQTPPEYGNFNFENFTITNAIAFHPSAVLLTGVQNTSDLSTLTIEKTPVQVLYDVFRPGVAGFYPLPQTSTSPSMDSNFSHNFYRQLHRTFLG